MTQRKKGKAFKTIRRRAWRIAVAHNVIGDYTVDSLVKFQSKINEMIDALNGISDTAQMPTNFSDRKIGKIADWGSDFRPTKYESPVTRKKTGHGHRQTYMWAMLHALYDEHSTKRFFALIDKVQQTHDALCDKLDAQGGILADTDFASTLAIEPLDENAPTKSRSKASFKGWITSSLSSHQLADEFIDSIKGCEERLNAILEKLDAGTLEGEMPAKLVVLDPEAKL